MHSIFFTLNQNKTLLADPIFFYSTYPLSLSSCYLPSCLFIYMYKTAKPIWTNYEVLFTCFPYQEDVYLIFGNSIIGDNLSHDFKFWGLASKIIIIL